MKIAVIGAGISGIVAARELCGEHEVSLFESGDSIGGHAHTRQVDTGGSTLSIDTGVTLVSASRFPRFLALLRQLDVQTEDVDIAYTIHCERTGLHYHGGCLKDLLNQRRNLLRPSYVGLLRDLVRFNRASNELLGGSRRDVSLRDFLSAKRYGRTFVRQYLQPFTASLWGKKHEDWMDFPAISVLTFLANHGLLQLRERPHAKRIVGGSQAYLTPLTEPFRDHLFLNAPVASVHRSQKDVTLRFRHGLKLHFDYVVIATHADQALALLADASRQERRVLSRFDYVTQDAVLHTDDALVPWREEGSSIWNFTLPEDPSHSVPMTYDLGRLQALETTKPILLTLNVPDRLDEKEVLRRLSFRRPVFSTAALQAQSCFESINGPYRTFYCGAYWQNGFHEDAVQSGQQAANLLAATAVADQDAQASPVHAVSLA